jgi:hypothetical protein
MVMNRPGEAGSGSGANLKSVAALMTLSDLE